MTIFEFSEKYNGEYDELLEQALKMIGDTPICMKTLSVPIPAPIETDKDMDINEFLLYSVYTVEVQDGGTLIFKAWLDTCKRIDVTNSHISPDIEEYIDLLENTKRIPEDKWKDLMDFINNRMQYDNPAYAAYWLERKIRELNRYCI
jgi:hypothetical protein